METKREISRAFLLWDFGDWLIGELVGGFLKFLLKEAECS
jgi:hypothetical protein